MTSPTTPPVPADEVWDRLTGARADYETGVAACYDEVLHEVSQRIAAAG